MKTRFRLTALALSFFVLATSCDNNDNDLPQPAINQTDVDFIRSYTEGNLGQISLNQLAADSGTNASLPAYTQNTLQQFRSAQLSLDSLAQRYSITLPTTADTATTRFRESLLAAGRGDRFDSLFVANQLMQLDSYINKLNTGSSQATEQSLKNYVNQQLPRLQQLRTTTDSLRLTL